MTSSPLSAARVETRVVQLVEQLRAGQPVEDSRTELKRQFPEPSGAARRIAAALNASRGSTVLFVFGVDEKAAPEDVVHGIAEVDFGEWWSQVCAEFSELSPTCMELAVPIGDRTVMAVSIRSDRPPYVVKISLFGSQSGHSSEREVPWRDGTRTRSAKRSELLKRLGPAIELPAIAIRHGAVGYVEKKFGGTRGVPYLSAYVVLYLTVVSPKQSLVFPDEGVEVTATLGGRQVALRDASLRIDKSDVVDEASVNAHNGDGQIVVHSSGPVTLRAMSWQLDHWEEPPPDGDLRLDLLLTPAGSTQTATLEDVGFSRSPTGAHWDFPIC